MESKAQTNDVHLAIVSVRNSMQSNQVYTYVFSLSAMHCLPDNLHSVCVSFAISAKLSIKAQSSEGQQSHITMLMVRSFPCDATGK